MNDLSLEQKSLLDQLAEALDLRLLEMNAILERLDLLRASVIRRDQKTLEELLQTVRDESARHQQKDAVLTTLTKRLERAFAIQPPACLSKIIPLLPSSRQSDWIQKQYHLRQAAQKVQAAYALTEMFLRQCIALNRQLMDAISGHSSAGCAYDAQGQKQWSIDRSLMNYTS